MILFVGAAISIPAMITAPTRAKYARAAGDAKFAVIKAIVYANDKGVYPTSIAVLREEGYIDHPAFSDKDPWHNDYVLSPVLTRGGIPREGDNVYVFSTGPEGTGVYPQPFTHDTGEKESIGYSSVHGSWSYNRKYACQKSIAPPLNLFCSETVILAVVVIGLIILGTVAVLRFVPARQKAKEVSQ